MRIEKRLRQEALLTQELRRQQKRLRDEKKKLEQIKSTPVEEEAPELVIVEEAPEPEIDDEALLP